jgi:hypothetical protein
LGLFHRDHIRCSDALMALYPAWRAIEWFLYEDIPYRRYEGLVQERLSALLARGLIATPAGIRCAAGCKAIAVATYRSQLAGLGPDSGRRIVQEPERYWRLGARAQ